MKKINWKILIFSFVIVYLTAFLGSLFTSSTTDSDWYLSVRPSITPPNWVFPIVWNFLFFLISISMYLAITSEKNKNKILIFFGINLFLNFFWSVLYFGLKSPLFAFFEIFLLWISIAILIHKTYKINKTSSYLLIPYFLWVSFAIVLNYLSIGQT